MRLSRRGTAREPIPTLYRIKKECDAYYVREFGGGFLPNNQVGPKFTVNRQLQCCTDHEQWAMPERRTPIFSLACDLYARRQTIATEEGDFLTWLVGGRWTWHNLTALIGIKVRFCVEMVGA